MKKFTFLYLLLVLLAGSCLLTGCAQPAPGPAEETREPDSPPAVTPDASGTTADGELDGPIPEAGPQDGPLSEEELGFFNQIVFNNEAVPFLRNQFLTSLYEAPEDIDLYQLFYNGAWTMADVSEAEREAVIRERYDGFSPDTDLIKCSAEDMNAILRRDMELTLEETNQVGLEHFVYLEDYDAYYDFHGDINALGLVEIAAGEWRDGLVHLYYEDIFTGDGWMCVTMRLGEDDGYKFVSHVRCDPSDVPSVEGRTLP